jgi:hypothetical protein
MHEVIYKKYIQKVVEYYKTRDNIIINTLFNILLEKKVIKMFGDSYFIEGIGLYTTEIEDGRENMVWNPLYKLEDSTSDYDVALLTEYFVHKDVNCPALVFMEGDTIKLLKLDYLKLKKYGKTPAEKLKKIRLPDEDGEPGISCVTVTPVAIIDNVITFIRENFNIQDEKQDEKKQTKPIKCNTIKRMVDLLMLPDDMIKHKDMLNGLETHREFKLTRGLYLKMLKYTERWEKEP